LHKPQWPGTGITVKGQWGQTKQAELFSRQFGPGVRRFKLSLLGVFGVEVFSHKRRLPVRSLALLLCYRPWRGLLEAGAAV
jgi:hypothetical protein